MGIAPDFSPGSRLLVVEDSGEDVFFLQRAFKQTAFQPPLDHVTDGALAQDYLERRNGFSHLQGQPFPRLILSDIKMPLCTGLELLAWLRGHPGLRHIPVIMWSSSDYERDVQTADAVGASYYLRKPQTLPGFNEVAKTLQRVWDYDCDSPGLGVFARTACQPAM